MLKEDFQRQSPFESGLEGQIVVHHGEKNAMSVTLGKGMEVRMNKVFAVINTSCFLLSSMWHLILTTTL